MTERLDVMVVGGGPAGLASAAELQRRGVGCRVFESGEKVGWCWRRLYDSLRLHTGKHLSALPGRRFPRAASLFPSRDDFVGYLEDYASGLAPAVATGCRVRRLWPFAGGWRAEVERRNGCRAEGRAEGRAEYRAEYRAERFEIQARAVIVATGILSTPRWPRLERRETFAGELMHAVDYRRPGPFSGKRALVVGCGNSAAEIATELAEHGCQVELSVRSGAHVVPRSLLGVPIQYFGVVMQGLPPAVRRGLLAAVRGIAARGPSPLPAGEGELGDSVPLIGRQLLAALRECRITLRPALRGIWRRGACFDGGGRGDYDALIAATGYRASLQPLAGLVSTDRRGFARRHGRVASADYRRLFFVGHNYDARGGLYNIRIDSRLVARAIAAELARRDCRVDVGVTGRYDSLTEDATR